MSNNILGDKKYGSQKILDQKEMFHFKKMLGQKKSLVQKIFGSTIFLESEGNVQSEKKMGFTKMLGNTRVEPKKF